VICLFHVCFYLSLYISKGLPTLLDNKKGEKNCDIAVVILLALRAGFARKRKSQGNAYRITLTRKT
jgi:hypothetical protein